MRGHVAVSPDLALPPQYVVVERFLRKLDSELRLRRSVQHAGFYVLERRTTRTKRIHAERRVDALGNEKPTDMRVSTRDGYLFISHVHPLYLDHPDRIVEVLRANGNDLQAPGQNAERFFQELVRKREEARERKEKFQHDEWRGYFAEAFDILDRVGDTTSHAERMRINNAGGEERFNIIDRRRIKPEDVGLDVRASAGERPAQEISDADTPGTTDRREDGQLHDQASV